jgi:hypothetical protein
LRYTIPNHNPNGTLENNRRCWYTTSSEDS